MPEGELIVGAVLAAPVLQDMAKRALGPTFDYIGAALAQLPPAAKANVQAVLIKALRKAGDAKGEEQVPPRVLKSLWDDAQFADDELRQDYLAGVLASARSENGRDDRAAAHANMVASLSTYALRTHYLLYAALQRQSIGKDADLIRMNRLDRQLYVRADEYAAGMAFSEEEDDDYVDLLTDSLRGLRRLNLIGSDIVSGDPEHLRTTSPNVVYPASGFIWTPTQAGAYFLGAAAGVRRRVDEAWVGGPERFALEAGPAIPTVTAAHSFPPHESSPASP